MWNEFKVYNVGGSCCTRRLSDVEGEKVFIKEINRNVQGIENGYDKFKYEIQHMKEHYDTGLYPEIIFEENFGAMYSVGMQYCYNGATLSDLVRNSWVNIEYFCKSFEYVMEELFERMYLQEKGKVIENYLDICYFDRILSRLNKVIENHMLEKYGFSDLIAKMMKEGCNINGVYYAPITEYIDYMRKDIDLLEKINVSYSTQCHYDLCPLNILVDIDFEKERISDFKLIDVRGEKDTGKAKRHLMYDMGKMLLGLDTFDIFRIFNNYGETFNFFKDNNGVVPEISFSFVKDSIHERYKTAYNYFWIFMEKKKYYAAELNEEKSNLRLKYLFSQCMMYHPDIPCRIICEKDEKLAILMYMRGLMCIKTFLYEVYRCDPVTHGLEEVDLWPI